MYVQEIGRKMPREARRKLTLPKLSTNTTIKIIQRIIREFIVIVILNEFLCRRPGKGCASHEVLMQR